MKSLIITVAGTATRFNKDTSEDTLKCIFNTEGADRSLLCQILEKAHDLDEFIIIGGYLYDKLHKFIEDNLYYCQSKIKLIYNPHYKDYGSGYSLILGIQNISSATDEVIFVEGDLYFDSKDFEDVKNSHLDVITVNKEPITAAKAVAVYQTREQHLRYLYDTSHSCLEIKEPFTAIYNSAQIWKFKNTNRLREIVDNLTDEQTQGTNLEIIQKYFD